MAVQPSKLLISFCAISLICLAGWVMDLSKTVVAKSSYPRGTTTELQIYLDWPAQLKSFIETNRQNGEGKGVFATLWYFAAARFHGVLNSLFAFNLPVALANITDYFKAVCWAWRYHWLYCIIFAVIKLSVVSIAGGSMCRIAALQFARGEKPGLTEALRFSSRRFASFFAVWLVPLGIITFAGLPIFVVGLICNIPTVGELVTAVFMPLSLFAGTIITVFVIGAAAGANLMYPAIAYDGSDSFDAVSRSINYIYSRPWRMGFYTAVAAIYGTICYTFVRFFAFILLWTTRWLLLFGTLVKNSGKESNKLAAIWPEPTFTNLLGSPTAQILNWSEKTAGFVVYLAVLIVIGLVVSFIISFYFSANTIIYAALRNSVDNTALKDIYTAGENAPAVSKVSTAAENPT